MKSTNFLIQEHKVILRALDVLDAMSASIERTETCELADVDKILEFLRWFADAHHQAKEETILFPALKLAAASQGRPVEHMILEHSQERSLVEEMEKDLRLAKFTEFVTCANVLSSTLRNHIYKEDRILFETADAILSAQDDDAVCERLTRFDTQLEKQLLEQKLAELRSLEWKYLRK
jgi:hemerythrin-like domain-containing protein